MDVICSSCERRFTDDNTSFCPYCGSDRRRFLQDLTGKKCGKLTVVALAKNELNKMKEWLCKCECGNETIVSTAKINEGTTTSCGCVKGIGKRTPWTEERDKELLSLMSAGMNKKTVAKGLGTSPSAINSRLHELKVKENIIRCTSCGTYFKAKTVHTKYCSDRCRWRAHKQQKYRERRENNKCTQCGAYIGKKLRKRKHCEKCVEYYKERYRKNKEQA